MIICLMTATAFGLWSCEKDNDNSNKFADSNEQTTVEANNGDSAVIVKLAEDIEVEFCLTNENKEKKVSFAEDENIVFNLTIRNNSSSSFASDDNLQNRGSRIFYASEDLFSVYTTDGELVGKPWSSTAGKDIEDIGYFVSASKSLTLVCPWYNSSTVKATRPIYKYESAPKLKPNQLYNVRFQLTYIPDQTSANSITKEIAYSFTVK